MSKWPELISRKIWVAEKSCHFHIVSPLLSTTYAHFACFSAIFSHQPHTLFYFLIHLQTGMRSYFNGGGSGSSATPPPSMSGRSRGSTGQIMGARSSSASLPRSPESDLATMAMMQGSSGSGQGSLGSHGSNQEVYVNIYQNTNHPSLFVSFFSKFSMHYGPNICTMQCN